MSDERVAVPVVLLDMDGVIADFELGFLREWTRRHPDKPAISLENRNTFHVKEQYIKAFGPDVEPLVEDVYQSKGFYLSLPLVESALAGIKAMEDCGLDIYICTAPLSTHRFCVGEKYEWIERSLGFKWTKKVIMTKRKRLILADVLIDDKPEVVSEVNPPWRYLLFDQPYNAKIDTQYRVSWKRLDELLSKIEARRADSVT